MLSPTVLCVTLGLGEENPLCSEPTQGMTDYCLPIVMYLNSSPNVLVKPVKYNK